MARKQKEINLLKMIIIIFAIIIIVILGINIIKKINKGKDDKIQNTNENEYVSTLQDESKLNTSEKLKEDKKLENLIIKDNQLTYKNGITNLLATVENTSNKTVPMQKVKIVLLDRHGNEIYTMDGVIEEVPAKGTVQFNTSITADFSSAYDFKIVKK